MIHLFKQHPERQSFWRWSWNLSSEEQNSQESLKGLFFKIFKRKDDIWTTRVFEDDPWKNQSEKHDTK